MKKRFSLGVVVALLSLTISLYPQNKTYATVPKSNTLISYNSSGTQGAQSGAGGSSVSKDGRYVAFVSSSTDIVSGDTNNRGDIFVKDTVANTIARIMSPSGTQFGYDSNSPNISGNGNYVTFYVDDLFTGGHVYIYDRGAGTTQVLTANSGGYYFYNGGISDDGRFVSFTSNDPALNSSHSSTNFQVYVKDMVKGTISLVSSSTAGGLGNGDSGNSAYWSSMSCDGRFIAFTSSASDLVAGDTNGLQDIFLADRLGGDIQDITINANANSSIGAIKSLSCDGNFITFASQASNLVSGDTNGVQDVFLYNRINDSITRVNVDSSGNQSSSAAYASTVSDGGQFVTFASTATDLVSTSTGGNSQVYLRDITNGTTEIVSVSTSGAAADMTGASAPVIESDGKNIFYNSKAQNLVNDWVPQTEVFRSATGQSVCSI